jgi:hypothetical protein
MNEDYLWDKSGQPDPEIQQLEEILGTLRYQPRELEIPAHIRPGHRSVFTRGLAIAAAIALVALGLGIWLGMQRQTAVDLVQTNPAAPKKESPAVAMVNPDDEKKVNDLGVQVGTKEESLPVSPSTTSRKRSAPINYRPRHTGTTQPVMSESEIAEALVAKDQLMMALRLASSKLNLAQKKTRGAGAEAEIHNQHKIG